MNFDTSNILVSSRSKTVDILRNTYIDSGDNSSSISIIQSLEGQRACSDLPVIGVDMDIPVGFLSYPY